MILITSTCNSCFPSAVQIAATELGLGVDRQLTQTGGLTFAGGPLNNYVTHSIATMANVLRDDPGSVGFCSANGGYITKHAFGVYSTTPPTDGFQHQDCQEEINTFPSVDLDADHIGLATVEAYTVMHGAEGPRKRARSPAHGKRSPVGNHQRPGPYELDDG